MPTSRRMNWADVIRKAGASCSVQSLTGSQSVQPSQNDDLRNFENAHPTEEANSAPSTLDAQPSSGPEVTFCAPESPPSLDMAKLLGYVLEDAKSQNRRIPESGQQLRKAGGAR